MSVFITFEGIEGCGKSTQISLLGKKLESHGMACLLTREPGATAIGSQIRSILLRRENTNIVPLSELLLYASDRAQHCEERIRPALKAGTLVLCDRFFDSTTAYQAGGRQIETGLVEEINRLATGGLQPDLTFLLDLPVELGLQRARRRAAEQKDSEDRFEREEVEFHERVRAKYLEIAAREKNRFNIVDAQASIEEVHQEISRHLVNILSV